MNVSKIKTAIFSVLTSIAVAIISFVCGKHIHDNGKREEGIREDLGRLRENTEELGSTEERLRGNNEKFRDWLERLTQSKQENSD